MIWAENAPGAEGGVLVGAPWRLGRPREERSIPGPGPPRPRSRAATHPRRRGARGAPPPDVRRRVYKAAGGEEIPNAGAEPQRSRQRLPAAADPRPTRRRDAVVPPPVRPGPALHRPGPRHRLGRPLGPAAPAVPAEVPGCRRREAGESPATGRPPRALRGLPAGHPDAPAPDPRFPATDPRFSSADAPRSPLQTLHFPARTPGIPTADPWLSCCRPLQFLTRHPSTLSTDLQFLKRSPQ